MRHELIPLKMQEPDQIALQEAMERSDIVYRHLVRKGFLHFSSDEDERKRLWAIIHLGTRKLDALNRHYRPILESLDKDIWRQEEALSDTLEEQEKLDLRIRQCIIPDFIRSARWKGLNGIALENAVKEAIKKRLRADFGYKPIDEAIDIITRLQKLDIDAKKKRLSDLKRERQRIAEKRQHEYDVHNECKRHLNDPKLGLYYRLALLELYELKIFLYDARTLKSRA